MEKCSVSAFIPYKLLATKFILQIFYILYIHNASISGSHSYPLNSQRSGPVCLSHSDLCATANSNSQLTAYKKEL